MTSQELQDKLTQAKEKVDKRKNTISKLCKTLNVNYDSLINTYSTVASSLKQDWLPSKQADEIVSQFIEKKPERDENGKWLNDAYEFNSKISQLSDNLSKLYEVERVANNWQVKYDTQKNKEEAPKIEVLWNFLNSWEIQARDWYQENAKFLVEKMNEFHQIAYKFLQDNNLDELDYEGKKALVEKFNNFFADNYRVTRKYRFGTVDVNDYIRKFNIDQLTQSLASVRFIKEDDTYSYSNNFGYEAIKGHYELRGFDLEKLNKILAQEKQNKYIDLCNRISEVVGEITDVSNLSIGEQKGELNGIVKGTKGNAKVETIGAGGYNVGEIVNVRSGQCFHYRVLVHKIA